VATGDRGTIGGTAKKNTWVSCSRNSSLKSSDTTGCLQRTPGEEGRIRSENSLAEIARNLKDQIFLIRKDRRLTYGPLGMWGPGERQDLEGVGNSGINER